MKFIGRAVRRFFNSLALFENTGSGGPAITWTPLSHWGDSPGRVGAGFRSLCKHAYGRNEVVHACVNEIATSASEAALRAFRKHEEIPNHPLRLLLNRPNPEQTEFELMESLHLHLALAGNAFWEKIRSGSGRVVELWSVRPDRMTLRLSADGRLATRYEIGAEDGSTFALPPEDVVHFRLANPESHLVGLSPVQVAFAQVLQDNEATAFAQALLENRAVPGYVVESEFQDVNDDLADRMRTRWRRLFGRGGREYGGLAFFQRGMKLQRVSQNMQELAFAELRSLAVERICMALEVSPILIGAKLGLDRSTFSNYEQTRESFWDETISPRLARITSTLNTDPDFGDPRRLVEFRFDEARVTALAGRRRRREEAGVKLFTSGLATRNEGRERAGLPPIAGEKGEEFGKGSVEGDRTQGREVA